MSTKLKPGDVIVTAALYRGDTLNFLATARLLDGDTASLGATREVAAQLNASLAVVERAKKLAMLEEGISDSTDIALALILEPDDAKRATMPGAEWLGGAR